MTVGGLARLLEVVPFSKIAGEGASATRSESFSIQNQRRRTRVSVPHEQVVTARCGGDARLLCRCRIYSACGGICGWELGGWFAVLGWRRWGLCTRHPLG